jgi:heme oxygenase
LSHNSPLIPDVHSVDVWPSASVGLRTETRKAHVAAEAEMDVSRLHDWADLAALLHGWDVVWSAVWSAASSPGACQEAVDELLAAAVQARRWIRSDLVDLGVTAVGSQNVESSDRLTSLLAAPADSWGVAYVLRGARLGGVVLAPRLRKQLGLPPACGTRFLESTGSSPARDWAAFRHRLDRHHRSGDELARAVEAARWTFAWVACVTVAGLSAVSR